MASFFVAGLLVFKFDGLEEQFDAAIVDAEGIDAGDFVLDGAELGIQQDFTFVDEFGQLGCQVVNHLGARVVGVVGFQGSISFVDEFLGEVTQLSIEDGVGDFEGAGADGVEGDFELAIFDEAGDEGDDHYELAFFLGGLAHEMDFAVVEADLGIAELLGEFRPTSVDEIASVVQAEQLVE